ncbi:MAG: site-specific integrase [Solirubrobacteraceae bacterium]
MLEFLTDLEQERGLARNTVDAYRSDLVQVGAFLAHRGHDALAVEPAELAAFLEELANSQAGEPPLAPATLQPRRAARSRAAGTAVRVRNPRLGGDRAAARGP